MHVPARSLAAGIFSATRALHAADGKSVAVLVHNRPSACLAPAAACKGLLGRLEDLELAELVCERAGERRVKVGLDEL